MFVQIRSHVCYVSSWMLVPTSFKRKHSICTCTYSIPWAVCLEISMSWYISNRDSITCKWRYRVEPSHHWVTMVIWGNDVHPMNRRMLAWRVFLSVCVCVCACGCGYIILGAWQDHAHPSIGLIVRVTAANKILWCHWVKHLFCTTQNLHNRRRIQYILESQMWEGDTFEHILYKCN